MTQTSSIFLTDYNIDFCARDYDDEHLGKAQEEIAKVLCYALDINDNLRLSISPLNIPYQLTNEDQVNLSKFMEFTIENLQSYRFMSGLFWALGEEYYRRNNQEHPYFTKMKESRMITKLFYILSKRSPMVNSLLNIDLINKENK